MDQLSLRMHSICAEANIAPTQESRPPKTLSIRNKVADHSVPRPAWMKLFLRLFRSPNELRGHKSSIEAIALSHDDRTLASASNDGTI